MKASSRRGFFKGVIGLGAAGAGALLLPATTRATPATPDAHDYASFVALEADDAPAVKAPDPPAKMVATQDNIEGPFYRPGAPFRGKVTPPLEPGTLLVLSGRVWGLDTRKPLAGAVLDVWQANAKGRYDNDDEANPPRAGVFTNRVRLVTDETGYYEFETIHPAPYQIGPKSWRPSHIHYMVRHPGYKRLITQLYFKGDKHNTTDEFIKESLIIELRQQKAPAGNYEAGTFDIVLAASK